MPKPTTLGNNPPSALAMRPENFSQIYQRLWCCTFDFDSITCFEQAPKTLLKLISLYRSSISYNYAFQLPNISSRQ